MSESSRQDEFQGEPAERIIIREQRRVLQNLLVLSFLK
ncbi:MAG: palindromic element RPE3 domain-containing protein [Rickettsia endosymbiont of Ecitomorpha arachnoides]|nr:palindromic element RPE3 domain-containing protein [Rickettsia endosymbiont of Sceptobius lativentris]MCC8462393.1 palindromic element RPE3 domain-containing protein [Rickettsia endosymbiont of Ecitomorpha arachnoides]